MNESTSTRHDFDFLFGAWTVHHRRLRERLAGCDDRQRFDGSSRAKPLLDGLGMVDEQFKGRPIRVRFRVLDTLGERPRWEQAFSTAAGCSWEVNWEREFERVELTP